MFMAIRIANSSKSIISKQHNVNLCRNRFLEWWSWSQIRSMTSSRRVQDRSHLKRIHALEIATEKWKIAYKVLFLIETLKQEPEMIIPVRNLDQYRRQINLPKPHRVSDFIRKSPRLFELYKDQRGLLWCGLTQQAEDLVEEEEKIIEQHADKTVEYVTRFLMMSVDKRLPVEKIAHFRRDFGLPVDFRAKWVNDYPELFKVVKSEDEIEYLELVSWNPAWAVTELEKKLMGVTENTAIHTPEAYDGPELIDKCPLILWKEKVLSLVGYRGKKKKIKTFDDMSEMEDNSLALAEDDSEQDMEDNGCSEENALDANTMDMETRDLLSV